MAPGKRRGDCKIGAKGSNYCNNNNIDDGGGGGDEELSVGDLVLAKVKGFPAWPAKITKAENWDRIPDPKKYFVQFFGTNEIAFVAPVDIQPFTSELKEKLLSRCKGKTVKYFSQAVKEICEVFEEPDNNSSDSSKDDDDVDGQYSQPDANFIKTVDDGMITDGQRRTTYSNDVANHDSGLDRYSRIHSEMGYEDIKPSVSSHVNDRHIESSVTKNSKDGTRRDTLHVSKNEVILAVTKPESGDRIRKAKKIKDEPHVGLTDDLSKDVVNNGVLHSAKKSKLSNNVSSKGGNEEVQKAKQNMKTKNRLLSKGQTNGSRVVGDEDVAQPTKRRRLVSEDRITESIIAPKKTENTDSAKSGTQVHVKRRAVRIFDEDEDEPKTPVHGRAVKVVDMVPHTSMSVEQVTEVVEGKLLHTPGKPGSEKKLSDEVLKGFVSPIKSPSDAYNKMLEASKANKTPGKVSGDISKNKGQSGSFKPSSAANDGGHRSQKNAVNERIRPVISGEIHIKTPKLTSRVTESATKTTPKSSSRVTESATKTTPKSSSVVQTTPLTESKDAADLSKSMRHLIAVAQAKRKAAQPHNHLHEGLNSPHTETIVKTPDSISVVQPTGHGVTARTDDQIDFTEFEERRTSSGHRPSGGSLSGGTEAAVARDTFEGMIETLSRTKESIGRATRHAIECAKHGIANEVVELLTSKLENESSFHRRVDLFFLVDSITQCSHKGIAGASYIPIVQASLPRLLGAAAPSGANGRENRRQCLKVLKLWLERKILPDTILRNYIEAIGSSSDGASAVFSSKRPSRADRAVDDPIREMEGMFVDEYGSNATFQLPGLLSSNVFEEEDEDDIINFSHKEGISKSPVELNTATGEPETCSTTSNERRHCILEDVDGELEMEDVSGHPKDEKIPTGGGSYTAVQEDEGSNRTMDTTSNNSYEVSPLREGSPPLPPGSPPSTPPLPSSPPPPLSPLMVPPPPSPLMVPPPPSTPSPPPPPPPPSPPPQTYPLHPGPPNVPFPQPAMPSMPPNVPLSSRLGAHFESAVRAEMYSQQPLSFLPSVPTSSREPSGFISLRTVEYGHETYTKSQGSQSSQHYQTSNVSLPPRTFQTPMVNQAAAGQFQYPKPARVQHPYSTLYGLTKPPDGPRRYGGDEQWRPPAVNEFSNDNHRGSWMSNGRISLSATPSFSQEGYFRPPIERPPTHNVTFQPVGKNIVSAGAPNSGHSGSLLKPSLNSWRPA